MERVRLEELCHIVVGRTPSRAEPRYWGGNHHWLSIADMTGQPEIRRTKERLSDEGAAVMRDRIALPGTVLLSFKLSIGKVSIARVPVFTNEAIAALPIRDESRLDGSYLAHYLAHADLTGGADRAAMGNTLNIAKLRAIEIPVPPLPEQRRIASILDQAATIAALRNGAVEVIDAMTGSIFNERFAQLDWPAIRLEELLVDRRDAIRTGPFGSQMLVEEFVDEGVQVLGIDNVRDNVFAGGSNRHITPQKYRELERYTVLPGDVLITIMGTVGRVCVVPDGIPLSISSKHLCALTLRRDVVLPEYVQAYVLHHPLARLHLNQTQKGAIMAGLNMSIIKDLPVIVPSLSEQKRFVADLATLGAIRDQAMLHQDQVRLLTDSLTTRAFKGEL